MNPVDPEAYNIFAQAETFMLTAEASAAHVGIGPGKNIFMAVPAIAAQAFATELYLKTLLKLEGKPIPRSHDLLSIYNKLVEPYKTKIKQYYNEDIKGRDIDRIKSLQEDEGLTPSIDFDFVLNEVKLLFPTFRYLFEQGRIPRHGINALVMAIMLAARRLVIELRPTWFTGFTVMPTNYLNKGITTNEAKARAVNQNPFSRYPKNQDRYYLGYMCVNCSSWVNFKIDLVKRSEFFITPEPSRTDPIAAFPLDSIYHCPICYMRSDVSSLPIYIEAHTGRKPDLSSEPSWITKIIGE